jgi:RibD C-terminal domain
VLVHGAVTAQLALTAGALDELHIHLVPVLLGQGRRLFEDMPPGHIELDTIRVFGALGRAAPAPPGAAGGVIRMTLLRRQMTVSLDTPRSLSLR